MCQSRNRMEWVDSKYCVYGAGAEEHRRVVAFGVQGSDASSGGAAEGLAGGPLDTLMRQSDMQKSVDGNATAGGGEEVDSRGGGVQNAGRDGGAVDGCQSQW